MVFFTCLLFSQKFLRPPPPIPEIHKYAAIAPALSDVTPGVMSLRPRLLGLLVTGHVCAGLLPPGHLTKLRLILQAWSNKSHEQKHHDDEAYPDCCL